MKVIGMDKSEIDDLSFNDINGYMEVMNAQQPKVTEKTREKNQVPSKQVWDSWTRRGKR